jgi:hypothetical protein
VGLKRLVFALFVVMMSATGFAADVETTKPPATDGKSSPSDAASYFEGDWAGKWPWGEDGVEITITVGKKNKNGMFGTGYSWGSGRFRNGTPIKSGSFKAWGKEQGDRFLIEWKSKEGVKSSITLIKGTEDSVKALYDTDGPFTGSTMSDRQTYLKRR